MSQADDLQSTNKLKPLQQTQIHLQHALNAVTQAQAMENKQAIIQTQQNLQMAGQTLSISLNQSEPAQQPFIEKAQQDLIRAQQLLQGQNKREGSKTGET
ncbi:hypothetical protein EV207_11819 [Scopulibacillus darangshiensis]|uniref:Uncharacterized protein n=1 Tax=Scopulibacillus darangshiensis TaxID=442528 RepID=A0A4R2NZR1_9BACL|nr:hypothetical protein [Scopulibacillus darangshiensis]TCP27041.1 hypothetical protein EV207_11819 [Scopulibacillus darangshiensis]